MKKLGEIKVNRFKFGLLKIVFKLLSRSLTAGYILDSGIKEEFDYLGQDYVIRVGILDSGFFMLAVKNGNMVRVFKDNKENHKIDLDVQFKNFDTCFKTCLGLKAITSVYAGHGLVISGDINRAVTFVRILETIESYLFPKFMWKKIINYKPKRYVSKIKFIFKTLFLKSTIKKYLKKGEIKNG